MGDTFVEQIVKKKLNGKDYMIMLGLSLAAAVVLFLAVAFLGSYIGIPMLIMLAVGIFYGYYKLITMRNLEFEYSFTNGDLTIDKIINRQRRKRLTSFDVTTVEEMGKYDAAKLEHRNFDKRMFVGTDESGKNCWYVACRGPKTGHLLLVFEPEERVLEAMKPYLQRQVRVDAFGR